MGQVEAMFAKIAQLDAQDEAQRQAANVAHATQQVAQQSAARDWKAQRERELQVAIPRGPAPRARAWQPPVNDRHVEVMGYVISAALLIETLLDAGCADLMRDALDRKKTAVR